MSGVQKRRLLSRVWSSCIVSARLLCDGAVRRGMTRIAAVATKRNPDVTFPLCHPDVTVATKRNPDVTVATKRNPDVTFATKMEPGCDVSSMSPGCDVSSGSYSPPKRTRHQECDILERSFWIFPRPWGDYWNDRQTRRQPKLVPAEIVYILHKLKTC